MSRTILMLEHDDDDRYITQALFDENNLNISIKFVTNSNELNSYLETCSIKKNRLPSLILLNYHAAPLNAIEILKHLKSQVNYSYIPVIVLSGSTHPDIVRDCYLQGASSFIQKPALSVEAKAKILSFVKYWFETVQLV
jgi:CheY-like chemotaxis protein